MRAQTQPIAEEGKEAAHCIALRSGDGAGACGRAGFPKQMWWTAKKPKKAANGPASGGGQGEPD